MNKPTNLVSTSHAQHAELVALFGGESSADATALRKANNEGAALVSSLNAQIAALEETIDGLNEELAAEKEAHAATLAALDAATKTAE